MTSISAEALAPEMTPDDEKETLILHILSAMGWLGSDYKHKHTTIESRLMGLGDHAVRQMLTLVEAHPEENVKDAIFRFLAKDDTDGFAFLGVETWTHAKLARSIRLLGTEKRYLYADLLQAPAHVLQEARSILAITNLCLSGELSNGSDNTRELQGSYVLSNLGLLALVQRHPSAGDQIVSIMREKNTCDAEFIEHVLATAQPLLDGVL